MRCRLSRTSLNGNDVDQAALHHDDLFDVLAGELVGDRGLGGLGHLVVGGVGGNRDAAADLALDLDGDLDLVALGKLGVKRGPGLL